MAAGEALLRPSPCLFPDSEWESAYASRAATKPDSDKRVIKQPHLYFLNVAADPLRCLAKREMWWFCLLIDFAFELPLLPMCGNRDKRESREKQSKNQVEPFCLLLSELISPEPVWTYLRAGSSVHWAGLCEPPSVVCASVGLGALPLLAPCNWAGERSRVGVGHWD